MEKWYFNDGGEQHGPIGREEIRSLLDAGKIQAETLVWSEGMADWKAAGGVFQSAVSPYAPPASDPAPQIDWSGYEPSGSQVRPWVRYWARSLDFLAFALLLGFVIGLAAPEIITGVNDSLLNIFGLLIYNFVEPVMLSVFGTTPFKALLRVRVRNSDGTKLSYGQALKRSLSVWLRGQGLGIPLVILFTSITSYNRLSKTGTTWWDEQGNFTVSHRKIGWWRWLLLIVAFAGAIRLIVYGNSL